MKPRTWVALVVGVLTGSAALAKDLPHAKVEPRATGCEMFGEGFHKIEGSDSCVKLGGSVRAEFTSGSGGAGFVPASGWLK